MEEVGANPCARKEFIFAQYLALECYPRAHLIASGIHAGPGQIVFGDYRLDCIDATVLESPGRILFFNFHESGVHYVGHVPGRNSNFAWTKQCWRRRVGDLKVFKSTIVKDRLKGEYCEVLNAMARQHGYNFSFGYHPIFECDLFHGKKEEEDLNSLMQSKYPEQYLHAWPQTYKSEKELLNELLVTKRMGGFLCIEKGLDGKDTHSCTDNLFGFCVTKEYPDPLEIGEYSRGQIERYGKSVENYCKRIEITAPRLNFKSCEVVSVQYLRWLVENRQFHGFKVIHVAAYKEIANLRGFLDKFMQTRWKIKKTNEGSELESLTCKLFVNGYYGFSSIDHRRYCKTRIVSEQVLQKTGLGRNVLNVTCMGCKKMTVVPRKESGRNKGSLRRKCWAKNPENDYQLLYAVTEKNTEAKIENVAQISAGILGTSKCIFFTKINFLTDIMDPALFQICYLDTDSIYMTIARDSLEECVKPGRMEEFEAKRHVIFENSDSDRHQGGLLKIEGEYRRAYFPGLKNYYLDNEIEEILSQPVKSIPSATYRAKGISHLGQRNLAVEHFKVSVDSDNVSTNVWRLRPQPNMTLGMTPVSRKLNKPLNLKRIFVVSL